MATVSGSVSAVDPSSELVKRRDAVLRRWLGMEVERASVGELAERPLSERLRELEALFDAAVHELAASGPQAGIEVREALGHALERYRTVSMPFTVAVFGAPTDDRGGWVEALTRAAEEGAAVVDAGDGLAAAILPGVRAREADVAVDRLRAHAWSTTGCQGRLPAAGRASCPEDGDSSDTLLSIAKERLQRMSDATLDRSRFHRGGEPAPVTTLYPELS
ncbi:MAG TPA: hypothetical protein VH256_08640 [Thermoleophilaceae bacterium]|jgi:hypothetical protein|nr:hypothetical protein [Thermoleophilaceae bacterium]